MEAPPEHLQQAALAGTLARPGPPRPGVQAGMLEPRAHPPLVGREELPAEVVLVEQRVERPLRTAALEMSATRALVARIRRVRDRTCA